MRRGGTVVRYLIQIRNTPQSEGTTLYNEGAYISGAANYNKLDEQSIVFSNFRLYCIFCIE